MNRAWCRAASGGLAIGLHLAACGRIGYSTADAQSFQTDGVTSTARVATCPLLGGAVFCEDFERGLPGPAERPAYEQTTSANGRVSLDPMARPGTSVLRASIAGGGSGNVNARLTYLLPASFRPPSYHMRAWFYLPAGRPPRDWMVLFELAYPGGKVSLDVYDGDFMGALAIGPTTSALPTIGLIATPRGRWFCAELAIELPRSPDDVGHLILEIDDTPTDNLTLPAGALPSAGFERLFFGMIASRLRDETHVLVDDVAVASAPIGCN